MPFRHHHPQQRPFQSFEDHQAEMAAWMHSTVDQMNIIHDPLHVALAKWLGIPSHAMREAAGAHLSRKEAEQARIEEEAVLYLQRYVAYSGAGVPRMEGVRE